MSDPLLASGNLSYTVGATGDVFNIMIGTVPLDELIDDCLEPKQVTQCEFKDIISFGKVMLIIESVCDD